MVEQLASFKTINECKDGGFIGNPFIGVSHNQQPRKENSRGLIVYLSAPLEASYVVRSLVGALKVFSECNL
jgi:hypothetical protein